MKAVLSSLVLTGMLLAQPPNSPAVQPAAKPPLTANQTVATLNGKPITAGAVEAMLHGAPPLALQSARSDPKNFLVWSYTMDELSAEAEKKELDRKSPHKDRVLWTRNQVLMLAAIEKQKRNSAPSDAEAKAWYEDNAQNYGSARVRIIYVATLEGKEAEAQAKLERVLAKLKSGADFASVARTESDDDMTAPSGGEFGPIDKTSKIHPEIRKAIFATKPGGYTEPMVQTAGHYIFQMVALDLKPFAEVREEIIAKISEERTDLWMAEQRRKAEVKLVNGAFFSSMKMKSLAGQNAIPESPGSDEEIKPETVLATLSGKDLTAEEFTGLIMAVPPQIRTNAMQQALPFLQQVSLMRNLAALSEKQGIDKQQPFAGRLRYNRNEILTQAAVDDYNNNIVIGPDAPKQEYDANIDRFRFAKVRALYIGFSLTPPPQTDPNAKKILNADEARLRAETILQEVRAGADFATSVKDYSDDEATRERGGELPLITATDPKIPDAIKQPVFAAKPGDVVGPVQLSNGFYLVKVEDAGIRPFEEVKDQIYEELRAKQFQSWFDGVRNRFQVEITDPAAFLQIVPPEQKQ